MCLKKLQKRIILKRLLVVGLRKVLNVLSFFVYKNQILDYYELNIKIFIQGMFGNKYTRSKDLVKKNVGDVFY